MSAFEHFKIPRPVVKPSIEFDEETQTATIKAGVPDDQIDGVRYYVAVCNAGRGSVDTRHTIVHEKNGELSIQVKRMYPGWWIFRIRGQYENPLMNYPECPYVELRLYLAHISTLFDEDAKGHTGPYVELKQAWPLEARGVTLNMEDGRKFESEPRLNYRITDSLEGAVLRAETPYDIHLADGDDHLWFVSVVEHFEKLKREGRGPKKIDECLIELFPQRIARTKTKRKRIPPDFYNERNAYKDIGFRKEFKTLYIATRLDVGPNDRTIARAMVKQLNITYEEALSPGQEFTEESVRSIFTSHDWFYTWRDKKYIKGRKEMVARTT